MLQTLLHLLLLIYCNIDLLCPDLNGPSTQTGIDTKRPSLTDEGDNHRPPKGVHPAEGHELVSIATQLICHYAFANDVQRDCLRTERSNGHIQFDGHRTVGNFETDL